MMKLQTMDKRPYRQSRRAEAAEATRRRILEAALEQLVSGDDFTVEAVATRAGVSRVTVYAQFGGRDVLREAVLDHIAATGGLGEIASAFTLADPLEGIGRVIDIFCRFYATHRTVLRRLHALAALSAGDGERPADRNARRQQILTVLLTRLVQLPAHRQLDIETTAATLQALTSFEFYDQLASASPAGVDPTHTIRALATAVLQEGQASRAPEKTGADRVAEQSGLS
jgi:AcrR family transcriptional regulator